MGMTWSLFAALGACTSSDAHTGDSATTPQQVVETVTYTDGLEGYLCVPAGEGPFPVAVYNHGGLGSALGGDPEATCKALMAEGYLGFSPVRRSTVPIEGHDEDVIAGIDYALAQERADPDRLAVLGFSRGGFLTVAMLTERPDVTVGVVMAPAPVNGLLYSVLEEADQVQATTLVLVAENDLPEFNNENEDHVATATAVYDALVGADKEAELVILDAWEDNGHDLFQELRDEYWGPVTEFLASRL